MTSSPSFNALRERREFVRLCAGLIGGLGIPGLFDRTASADETNPNASQLSDSYLEKGLTGMARSKGWFNSHLGAAVLAGYYMCKENPFSETLVTSIRGQLDALIKAHEQQFEPFGNLSADKALVADIPESLRPAVEGGLRAHGHAVIYTGLAVRALRDAPHVADPRLIKLICTHNGEIARKKPALPTVQKDYPNIQAMIEALFDSLARFEPLVGYPSLPRPNFVHMTTHTEALMTLDTMGFTELVKIGQLGQQAHIDEPVPKFDPAKEKLEKCDSTLDHVMSEEFWQDKENLAEWNRPWGENKNRNGYWLAFGHLFKVLYSFHRLIKQIEDKEKVAVVSRVLLERVVNPKVGGG